MQKNFTLSVLNIIQPSFVNARLRVEFFIFVMYMYGN